MRFLSWMAARIRHYGLALALIVMVAWAFWYFEAKAAIPRPLIAVTREIRSMISWDSTLPSGGTIHIEVYRRDYESDEAWLLAVETLQQTYPPDSP